MALQILLIVSMILFIGGAVYTLIINANTQVSMNGDFWDMPLKIKLGIISFIVGALLFIIWTVLYMWFNWFPK